MSSLPSVAAGGAGVAPPSSSTPSSSSSSYPEPHLKRVLRSYQSAASSSLSGPNGILAAEHVAEQLPGANPGLMYYNFANVPLSVVAKSLDHHQQQYVQRAAVRVKCEPDEEASSNNNMAAAPQYDQFKLWKLKQPAYYAIVKDKDAVDLSSSRSETAAKPAAGPSLAAPPASLHQQQQQQLSPQPSFPILSAPDRSGRHAERGETLLEGHAIACFTVGGEPRLCLPQILNTVLNQLHISDIYAVRDELQINCSRCTAEQLESLKAAPAILPRSAASCGLITKTDAQRLCSALLRRSNPEPQQNNNSKRHGVSAEKRDEAEPKSEPRPPASPVCKTEPEESDSRDKDSGIESKTSTAPPSPRPGAGVGQAFRVYHQCFGKCEGICRPEMYASPDAACIECADCGLLLSPVDFISHAHRAPENRTCHWGFDAAQWRAYLLLARRQPAGQHEALLRQLDEFKSRFDSRDAGAQQPTTAAPAVVTAAAAVKRKFQVEDMLKPSTKASESLGFEQQPYVKRYKDHLVVVGSGGRQSPPAAVTPYEPAYVATHVYGAYPGAYVLGVPRESPPLLQEAPSRVPLAKDGQPNVALLAPPRPALPVARYHQQPAGAERADPAPSNPEIELSSTDTDDSDSMQSQNGDDKSNWDLPASLANEVNSVEDLLRRGGCDSSSSRMILQAFRRLAYRVSWAEEKQQLQQQRQQQQQQRQHEYNRSPSVLKLRTDLTAEAEVAKYKSI